MIGRFFHVLLGDDHWGLKVLCVAGLILCSYHLAARTAFRVDPPFWALQARLPGSVGATAWVAGEMVAEVRPDGVQVRTPDLHAIFVRCEPEGVRVRDRISARGVLCADGSLQAEVYRVHRGYGWKRPANYVASLAAFALVLLIGHREFRVAVSPGPIRPRG